MSTKQILSIVIIVLVVFGFIVMIAGGIGKNNDQNWQIIQSVGGKMTVRDTAGYYLRWFATVTTYPRAHEAIYNAVPGEGKRDDESIRVTFNDGGTAKVETMVRFQTPTIEKNRRKFHRDFNASMKQVERAVKSHLINCCKATAPLMSASEHQSARKAEFAQHIEDMLRNGRYKMRKIEKELKDRTDEKGKPITVFATEIVLDDQGMPVVDQISPLGEYDIRILQFSVTGTDYDNEIKAQFIAKKESYLEAEKAKAERERQVQQRLMVQETKLAELAEITGEANKEKMKAVIAAQKKAEVALQVKKEQETKANMALEVAKINKSERETIANMKLSVASINLDAADKDAQRIIKLAHAEEKRIQLAGAITEKDRVLAEIKAKRDVEIALSLANVRTPTVVFSGGGEGPAVDTGESIMKMMINYRLLEGAGLLPTNDEAKTTSSTTK